MTRREQVAWAAGLIDGEGCIGINYESYGVAKLHVRLRVVMTHRGAVERLRDTFEAGTITRQEKRPPRREVFCWYLQEPVAALRVLEQLTPYLIVKHWEALLAIALLKNPQLTREQRHLIYEESKSQKQRPKRAQARSRRGRRR